MDIEDLGGRNAIKTAILKKKGVSITARGTLSSKSTTKNIGGCNIRRSVQVVSCESNNTQFVINHMPVVLLLVGGAITSLGMIVSGLRMKYRLKLNE